MNKRLYRSSKDSMIAGVAGGLAEYFGIDPVIVRIAFVVVTISGGFGVLAYILLWIVVPVHRNERIESEQYNYSAKSWQSEQSKQSDYANRNKSQGPFYGESSNSYMPDKNGKFRKIAAIVLIVIGSLLLIDNFHNLLIFDNIGPVILIAIGVVLLLNSKKTERI